jgi:hypothetical protein
MQFSDSPFQLDKSEQRGVDLFRELLWQNAEVCNNCFTQVRDIGPEYSNILRRTGGACLDVPDMELTTNEWYERTESASQEHSTFDENRRHGQCYCMECGADLSANHRGRSLDELREIARSAVVYITEETPQEIDGADFVSEVEKLKREPENQSWETEILAVAFARSLQSPAAKVPA